MKKEFMVERQGKTFVLYAGLLAMAHEQGLKSIRTELIQVPSEANNRVAICTATVILEKDGQERTFTGIGDAAPNNVAPAMQTCLMRMAETRSKARALRDAVNVGVAAFEELGDEDVHDSAPERGYRLNEGRGRQMERGSASSRSGRSTTSSVSPGSTAPSPTEPTPIPADFRNPAANLITDAQTEAVRNLCRRRGLDADALVTEKFGADSLAALTQAQAGEMIKSLSAQSSGRAVPTA